MAADDIPEKSLFIRIKDCDCGKGVKSIKKIRNLLNHKSQLSQSVLTELQRGTGKVKSQAPCKSREMWHGRMKEKNIDEVPESRKSEEPGEAGKVTTEIEESLKSQRSSDQAASQTDDNMINDCECQRDGVCDQQDKREDCPIEKNDSSDKSMRHYHIKMQNPEAPPCCEHTEPRRVFFPNTRKVQTHNSRPSNRCSVCAASFEADRDGNCYQEKC